MQNTLSQCKQGDIVVIQKMRGSGAFKNRLREMGFIKGEKLEIIRYAPLQDPLELRIKGYNVSLRIEEAAMIDVETTE